MTDSAVSGKDRYPRLRRLGLRLLLALASLGLTMLVLEGVARLAFPVPMPVYEWEGLYASVLPLVNGRPDFRTLLQVEASGRPTMKKNKASGELRVFVFGESSVEGTPFGHEASPPSLLRDRLHRALPGRSVTVVNMGRSSSYLMDTWYYLLGIRHLNPDYIVFYQGSNDDVKGDPEMCAPVVRPLADSVWRFLVQHSHLLWTVRVHGPDWLAKRSRGARPKPPRIDAPGRRCPEEAAFAAWTRLVMKVAESTGAKVVVVTPVENILAAREFAFNRRTRSMDFCAALKTLDSTGRRILPCALQTDCDLLAAVRQGVFVSRFLDLLGASRKLERWNTILRKAEAWRRTAQASAALLVDFQSQVLSEGDGLMCWPHLIDEVHLTLSAARLWSRLVGDAILADLAAGYASPEHDEDWLADAETDQGTQHR